MPDPERDRRERLTERARAQLDAGESVGDLLRALREEVGDELITALIVVRAASGVGLGTARFLVEPWWFGREPRDHLLLPDLRWLAEVEAAPCLRTAHLDLQLTLALINRRPLLTFTPLAARDMRDAIAALPARWSTEVEVVRDEPDGLVVRFPRVAPT